MSSQPVNIATNVGSTLGALEIGLFVSIFLFGSLTVQTYTYYGKFPEDSKYMKSMITATWFLELGHTICISYMLHSATITYDGRGDQIVKFSVFYASVFFSNTTMLLVQLFFIFRVWKLTGPHVPVFGLFLASAEFVINTYLSVKSVTLPTWQTFVESLVLSRLLTATFIIAAIVDTLNTICLCWVLTRYRRDAFENTIRVIDGLLRWTLQTGLITSIISVAGAITSVMIPRNPFIWVSINVVIAKLYSNTLLASANSRTRFRKDAITTQADTSGRGVSGPIRFSLGNSIGLSWSMQYSSVFGHVSARAERIDPVNATVPSDA